MTGPRLYALAFVTTLLGLTATEALAEPMFLARQYARCTTCHYSPTGGGMLTPYGRSLSRQELSTTGHSDPNGPAAGREQDFLWGALGSKLGALDLSLDARPAHQHLESAGATLKRDFFMNADILAAYRIKSWTLYGQLGREPLPQGAKIASYEYWVAHQAESGFGFRVGRFLPAYGINLADHTAFTRRLQGFDVYDQVYGLELSQAGQHYLAQVSASPGTADSVLHHHNLRAFTTSGRFQFDLRPRVVLVLSGLYRGSSKVIGRNGSGGVALGLSPWRHLTIWNQADAYKQKGIGGAPAYTLLNETSLEVYRGVWLKFSPQLRTVAGDTSAGTFRTVFEADVYPRTHFNLGVSYYRDRDRATRVRTTLWLLQMHLYL